MMIQCPGKKYWVIALICASCLKESASAALITYYFQGVLTQVNQVGAGPSGYGEVDHFGTLPLGTTLSGSFSYYDAQSGTGRFLYSEFEFTIGSDHIQVGPNTNYAPGFLGPSGPGGDPFASFVVVNGAEDSLSINTSLIGLIGGRAVGGSTGSVYPLLLDSTGTVFANENLIGSDLDISDFTSANIFLNEQGYFLGGFQAQRGVVTLNYFSTTPVPEPEVAGLGLLAFGAMGFTRRRRNG